MIMKWYYGINIFWGFAEFEEFQVPKLKLPTIFEKREAKNWKIRQIFLKYDLLLLDVYKLNRETH